MRKRALQGGAVWALVWALLLAPALGLWHEVSHGHGSATPAGALAVGPGPSVSGADANKASGAGPHPLFERLFFGHTRSDCLQLDQAALSYALTSAALAVPVATPQGCPAVARSAPLARRHVAHFHARGPPAPWALTPHL